MGPNTFKWGPDTPKVVGRYRHIPFFFSGGGGGIGGFAHLKSIAYKGSDLVISKLSIWQASIGVSKAVIEGVLLNRIITRVPINIPSDAHLSSVEATIARTYRHIVGIPYHTPPVCTFWVVGTHNVLYQMWMAALIELQKAMCSESTLLEDALWEHGTSPRPHRLNSNIHHLKRKSSRLGITFIRVASGDGFSWSLGRPPSSPQTRALYVFADASRTQHWGGAVLVKNSEGHEWLRGRVTLDAVGLSTALVEATMIVSAIKAAMWAMLQHGVSI